MTRLIVRQIPNHSRFGIWDSKKKEWLTDIRGVARKFTRRDHAEYTLQIEAAKQANSIYTHSHTIGDRYA